MQKKNKHNKESCAASFTLVSLQLLSAANALAKLLLLTVLTSVTHMNVYLVYFFVPPTNGELRVLDPSKFCSTFEVPIGFFLGNQNANAIIFSQGDNRS